MCATCPPGCLTLAEVTAAAPADLTDEINAALSDPAWTAHTAQTVAGPGGGRALPGGMLDAVLAQAASIRQARKNTTARQAQKDAEQTCPVTGQLDPTTRQRALPWSTPLSFGQATAGIRCSDRGYLVLIAAALATVTPDEMARAQELLAQVVPPAAEVEDKPRRKRRG